MYKLRRRGKINKLKKYSYPLKNTVPFIFLFNILFMKKHLLLLLACRMFVSAFAQNETEKWEIIKVNAKGSTGKLFVTLPKGTEWDVTIYAAGSDKVLSFTRFQQIFVLLPGSYDLEINHIKITGVPVEKGNNTRLKAGVLHITNSDSWWLYDETKQQVLLGGSSPQTRGLPVGKYILTIMGQDQDVEIKDEPPGQEKLPIIETDKWVMSPTYENEGRLTMKFPLANPDPFFPLNNAFAIVKAGESYYGGTLYSCHHILTTGLSCPTSYELPEGNYDIYFMEGGETLNHLYKISNVPIRYKYETRLKVGYFKFLAKGLYHIYDASMQHLYFENNVQGRGQYPLPVGLYHIKLFFVGEYQLQINDGGVSVLNPMDSAITPKSKWIVTSILNKSEKLLLNLGRLNTSFPEANNISMVIRIPNPNSGNGYTTISLATLKSYDLLPGNYPVYLNFVPINLPIQAGKETKIRFGYFQIIEAGMWNLCNEETGAVYYYTSGDITRKIALPIGYYTIVINYHSYLIRINEGETLDFHIPLPSG